MLPLFAQGNRPPQPGDGPPPEFWAIFLGVMCVAVLIGLAIQVFFLLTLSKALKQCDPAARTLEPGQVWLNLIPFFNIYWTFVLATRVPESLRNEFKDRRMHRREEDYGAGVGKWYAICTVASVVPILNYIAGPAALILWILFWVKTAGYSRQLAQDAGDGPDGYDDRPRRSRRRDDEGDEYEEDDRPRNRRRRDDDDEEDDEEDDRPRRR